MPLGLLMWLGLGLLAGVFVLAIVILLKLGRRAAAPPEFSAGMQEIRERLERSERGLLDQFARDREVTAAGGKLLRDEVRAGFVTVSEAMRNSLADLAQTQKAQLDGFGQTLAALKAESASNAKALREEMIGLLNQFGETVNSTITRLSQAQAQKLDDIANQVRVLTGDNEVRQEKLRKSVEDRLDALREDNAAKLEQMRATVDEKLQGTLQDRLGVHFDVVSKQLEQVHRGVGEMQALASGVGDLKRVLTNVKTRGTWGEVALGNLLEQVMAADQFARNVEIKPGSGERVEFAIKMPGQGEDGGDRPVWLPIDSKFPSEDYERLVNAAERGDVEAVEASGTAIENRIRSEALKMSTKYVSPPHSTDFGVLFLPTEGLYAEVIRRPGLVDSLQRDHRLLVAGPTILAALLNSLRMGFRSLAIQKRSSEVWQMLGAVKTEFDKYGDVLDKVKKKLEQAGNEIDNVARRQRAIHRALTGVESIPELQAENLLQIPLIDPSRDDDGA